MMLQWGGLSYLQLSTCIVSCCTQEYHIPSILFVIDGNNVGRCNVVSLMEHCTLCISFFVFFATHCRYADTTIYACAFIFRHVLPWYIPGIMLPRICHFGPDEKAAPRYTVIRPHLLHYWRVEWNFLTVTFSSKKWRGTDAAKLFCHL